MFFYSPRLASSNSLANTNFLIGPSPRGQSRNWTPLCPSPNISDIFSRGGGSYEFKTNNEDLDNIMHQLKRKIEENSWWSTLWLLLLNFQLRRVIVGAKSGSRNTGRTLHRASAEQGQSEQYYVEIYQLTANCCLKTKNYKKAHEFIRTALDYVQASAR